MNSQASQPSQRWPTRSSPTTAHGRHLPIYTHLLLRRVATTRKEIARCSRTDNYRSHAGEHVFAEESHTRVAPLAASSCK